MSGNGMVWRNGKILNDKRLLQNEIKKAKAKAKRELNKNPNAYVMDVPNLKTAMENINSRDDYNTLINDLKSFNRRGSMRKSYNSEMPVYTMHLSDNSDIVTHNGFKMKMNEFKYLFSLFQQNEKRKEKRRKKLKELSANKYKVGALTELNVKGVLEEEFDNAKPATFERMFKYFRNRKDVNKKLQALQKQLSAGYDEYRDEIHSRNFLKACDNVFNDEQYANIKSLYERLDSTQSTVFSSSYIGQIDYVYSKEDLILKYTQIMNHLYYCLGEDTELDFEEEYELDYGEFDEFEW